MNCRTCAVIPTFNHSRALPEIVERLHAHGLAVFVVDDGSTEPARSAVAALAEREYVVLHRLDRNRGKGAAVIAGLRLAAARGFTHAVQIDADGQHNLDDLPHLLAESRANPDALVSGAPVFDATMPRSRRLGRWLTHVWVFVETLSFAISDSMCGFRVYPIEPTLRLAGDRRVGSRMDFDTEIMVRLFWRGVRPVMVPVNVTYPAGNTSNFRLLRDNVRISWMHTRLVFAMPFHLPAMLAQRRARGRSHWALLAERGSYLGLRFLALAYRLLGRSGCLLALSPIVFYFFVTDPQRRLWSRRFLARAYAARGEAVTPTLLDVYRHFMSFAAQAVDVFGAWIGALRPGAVVSDDPIELQRLAADPRGAVLVVSHLGNAELSRALLDERLRSRITVLVHTRHAENYNRVVREFRPEAASRVIEVTDIGPDTAVALKDRVERGEWIAIAGDRSPVLSRERIVKLPFLGKEAPFPQGPWILAFLLECPVYVLWCCREGHGWRLTLKPLVERIHLPRGSRQMALSDVARRYVTELEAICLKYPFQWFNFFDFWAES
jgi:predicted LPLAT superfamily acyltransferase